MDDAAPGGPSDDLPAKVVVPLDGSTPSRSVLPFARSLAASFGVDVVILTVGDGEAEADVRLQGDPVEAILDHLHQAPDVVVCLTSHGRGGLGRRLIGSAAEGLIHHSPAPVVVAGPHAAGVASAPRSILAGVAWPPEPHRLVALLARWAPALAATVELAHVRLPSAVELYAERVTGHGPPDRPDLGRLAEELVEQGVDVGATRLVGAQPEDALRRRADELIGPVLLAVESHRGDRDPVHDVAYQLIRQARWPVLATTGS